ncbi:cyclase family protein [Streptomyces stelliscabiei]
MSRTRAGSTTAARRNTITPHGGAAFAASTRPGNIVSRGVLLDIPRALGRDDDRLPGDHAVTPEDLDAAEELAGTRVRAGDIVPGPHRADPDLPGRRQARGTRFPSPGLSVTHHPEWFHARDVAAVANDTLTFEIFPPEIEDLWLRCTRSTWSRWACRRGRTGIWKSCPQPVDNLGGTTSCSRRCPNRSSGATGTPVAPIALL